MRRTNRVLHLLLVAVLAVTGAFVTGGCGKSGGTKPAAVVAAKYHCPMHPDYTSAKAGDCPICGMALTPIEAKPAAAAELYTCPMHPDVKQDHPGDCPICGMALVKAERGAAEAASAVEGRTAVELDERTLELTGIRTEPATRGVLERTVRTVGEVKADESRLRHVHSKVSGVVEHLHVNFNGQAVRRGQPLLALYSPELVATEEEFVRALDAARTGGSDASRELVAAARRRLELFDVPAGAIAELERTRHVQRTITLDAPVGGFVSSKDVYEGMRIEAGLTLLTVTDLARVWVEARVYENEAPFVRVGQSARLSFADAPQLTRTARVTYVDPFLDTQTRTLKVRFELDNPAQALRPGMYADVDLAIGGAASGPGVLVPDGAILDTGTRQIVYVKTGERRFEPRVVRVGGRSGDRALVLEGLKEGEEVVTQANFLLDSESRLRAQIAGSSASSGHEGHQP
ncbi:MAG: efflux RND transporter periplasmic adaptor subunit [Candidatus Eisenbacteria bacterium]